MEDVKKFGKIDKEGNMSIDDGIQKQTIGRIKEKISKKKSKKNIKLSPLDLEEKKKVMINYIFDEDKIHKIKTFTQSKFNENTLDVKKVLKLFPVDPLFGNTISNKKGSKTKWFTFMKIPGENNEMPGM